MSTDKNKKEKIQIPFTKLMPAATVLSIIVFVLSIILIVQKFSSSSVNLGIDFAGGVELKVQIAKDDVIDIGEMRSLYSTFPTSVNMQEINGIDNKNAFLLRFKGDNDSSAEAVKILEDKYGVGNVSLLGNTIVSGVVSNDNLRTAFILLGVSWIIIMIYITIRFDIRYAFPAIITLIHNIVIVFALLLLFNRDITVLILSALLTLIGYTINDTIVVFDRIRENVELEKSREFKDIVNVSLNQVLSRTIMTSVSTLIASSAILIWGGEILFGFALTFTMGVIVGTYASNFIASRMLILFMKSKTLA